MYNHVTMYANLIPAILVEYRSLPAICRCFSKITSLLHDTSHNENDVIKHELMLCLTREKILNEQGVKVHDRSTSLGFRARAHINTEKVLFLHVCQILRNSQTRNHFNLTCSSRLNSVCQLPRQVFVQIYNEVTVPTA